MITITHDGKTLSVRQWSELTGLPIPTITYRLRMGWPNERVLSEVDLHANYNPPRVTKNDAEMALNDMPISQLPAYFVKLINQRNAKRKPQGRKATKFGSVIREEFRKDFDKWFEAEYIRTHKPEANGPVSAVS